jgi:hypothetical protein
MGCSSERTESHAIRGLQLDSAKQLTATFLQIAGDAVPIANFTRNTCYIRPAGCVESDLDVRAVLIAETHVFVLM